MFIRDRFDAVPRSLGDLEPAVVEFPDADGLRNGEKSSLPQPREVSARLFKPDFRKDRRGTHQKEQRASERGSARMKTGIEGRHFVRDTGAVVVCQHVVLSRSGRARDCFLHAQL